MNLLTKVCCSPIDTVRRGDDHQWVTGEKNGATAEKSSASALLHHGNLRLNHKTIIIFLFYTFLPWYLVFMNHSATHDLGDVPDAAAQLTAILCVCQKITEEKY